MKKGFDRNNVMLCIIACAFSTGLVILLHFANKNKHPQRRKEEEQEQNVCKMCFGKLEDRTCCP